MEVLVTGATGYVGGRLVPRLLEAGHRVRVLVRDLVRLEGRPWAGQVEVVRGSLEDPTAPRQALSGVEAAYYLVHAMLSEENFPQAEERQARTFAQVAQEAGLGHMVYLGGLLPREVLRYLALENDERLWPVEDVLRAAEALGVPVVVDTLHHALNPGRLSLREVLELAFPTWRGRAKVHLASQDPRKRPGAPAFAVAEADWEGLLGALPAPADVMVEAKGKEQGFSSGIKRLLEASQGFTHPKDPGVWEPLKPSRERSHLTLP